MQGASAGECKLAAGPLLKPQPEAVASKSARGASCKTEPHLRSLGTLPPE